MKDDAIVQKADIETAKPRATKAKKKAAKKRRNPQFPNQNALFLNSPLRMRERFLMR
jgi:hypothetical protein